MSSYPPSSAQCARPVVRIILGVGRSRYSEPSWTCGCGKFVGFSRRVAESDESKLSRVLRPSPRLVRVVPLSHLLSAGCVPRCRPQHTARMSVHPAVLSELSKERSARWLLQFRCWLLCCCSVALLSVWLSVRLSTQKLLWKSAVIRLFVRFGRLL